LTKNFALIGASGYIAPRHMKAIHDNGCLLVAALDRSDSVGVIDSYFPQARFFTEFERFDRHVDKLRRTRPDDRVEMISICSPNYLHDSHIRFGLRSQADVICEKPLVLNPHNIDGLEAMQAETGRRVHTILQLRLHPSILALKQKIEAAPKDQTFDVELTYVTARGHWYLQSWKGEVAKSGGIATNIGVHLFDMLHFLFGPARDNAVHLRTDTQAAGTLTFARATARWVLSIEHDDIPDPVKAAGQRTFRQVRVNAEEIEFSSGFADLHTQSYAAILSGAGFGLDDARPSIETVARIRTQALSAAPDQMRLVAR